MSILQTSRNWLFCSSWCILQNEAYGLQNGENKILVMGKMCENWEKKHFRFCFLGEVGGIFQDRHQLPIQNISEMTQWIIPEMGVPIFSDFFFQAIYSPPLLSVIFVPKVQFWLSYTPVQKGPAKLVQQMNGFLWSRTCGSAGRFWTGV